MPQTFPLLEKGIVTSAGFLQPFALMYVLPTFGASPSKPEAPVTRSELLDALQNIKETRVIDPNQHYYKGLVFHFPTNFQYPPNLPRYYDKTNTSEFLYEILYINRCYANNLELHIQFLRQSLE